MSSDRFSWRPVRWPIYVSAIAGLAAIAMLVLAWLLDGQTSATRALLADPSRTGRVARFAAVRHSRLDSLPTPQSTMQDIRTLNELAASKQVNLMGADYKSETIGATGLEFEQVDLQLEDEYPKLKAFLSATLAALPNAFLRDFELQRASGQGPVRVRAAVRLSLAYRTPQARMLEARPADDAAQEAVPPRMLPAVAVDPFDPKKAPHIPAAAVAATARPANKKSTKTAEAPPPPPPPAPTAPPLPFVAIGTLSRDAQTGAPPVAYLQQHEQLLVVRAGQQLGTTYRVESISPERIELTYLPLMQRQVLPLGPSS